MNTKTIQLARAIFVLFLSSSAPAPQLNAQAPAELGVQLYAGLTITGTVGAVYSIEYVKDLQQTNNPSAWRCLEFLQLPSSPYLWADKSSPANGQRFYRAVAFAAPTNMVFIPPGTFRMSSPTNEADRMDWEGAQTPMTIVQGFWMGKHEVTQAEYQALIGRNPSRFVGDPDLPVETVNWYDAVNYGGKLTEREMAEGRLPVNCRYSLPTEAQWEYACRGWTSTRFSYGDDPGYTNLTNYAWYMENSRGTTHPVGRKMPNPFGLYDMQGNVLEWCKDIYTTYPGGPDGPLTSVLSRAIREERWYAAGRGGSWTDPAKKCRSASLQFRDGQGGFKNPDIGFRLVLVPGQP